MCLEICDGFNKWNRALEYKVWGSYLLLNGTSGNGNLWFVKVWWEILRWIAIQVVCTQIICFACRMLLHYSKVSIIFTEMNFVLCNGYNRSYLIAIGNINQLSGFSILIGRRINWMFWSSLHLNTVIFLPYCSAHWQKSSSWFSRRMHFGLYSKYI